MKEFCISFLLIFLGFISLSQDISTLPEWNIQNESLAKMDWLVADCDIKANVYKSADGEVVVQRPVSILLKVQVPVIKTEIA